MSRPMVLFFLLVVLVVTSQFEWKQQLAADLDAGTAVNEKQQRIGDRAESVKEKIILSQEKNIQRLNELVQTLQQQLLRCQSSMNMSNNEDSFETNNNEIEKQQFLQD